MIAPAISAGIRFPRRRTRPAAFGSRHPACGRRASDARWNPLSSRRNAVPQRRGAGGGLVVSEGW